MIEELVKGNRSYRRFHQEAPVSLETLRGLVNLARLSASAANLQPLKYCLSCEPEQKRRHLLLPGLGRLPEGLAGAGGRASGPPPTSSSWGTRRSPRTSAATTASRPKASSWGPGSRAWGAA